MRGAARNRQVVEGDCADEPAVQMLLDWRSGLPVYPSPGDSAPPPDWVLYQHPALFPPYLIPPDWTPQALWAETLTPAGEPIWQSNPPAAAQVILTRMTSPDERSVFEFATGAIQGVLLTTQEAALVGKQGLLGENPRLRQGCLIDDQENPLSPAWFSAERHRSNLVISFGNAMQLPDAFLPATVVSYTNILAPRRNAAEMMYEVFLRMLFQFLGGGGSEAPTPTPTP